MRSDRLVGVDRAAVLLLSLGADAASAVMRHLDEGEVRQVSQALSRMRRVGKDEVEEIGRDFHETLVRGAGLAVNGKEFALSVVNDALADESAVAASQRTQIVAELEEGDPENSHLTELLEGIPASGLVRLLDGEHPQVAALILAHVPAGSAADAIAALPETMQTDVIERLARLEAVASSLTAEVGSVLEERVKGLSQGSRSSIGGPKAVAEVMNHADKELEARVFGDLEEVDAELANEIRTLMFTFDDCVNLDGRSLQTLLKEVARDDLLVALKTASAELKDKIFSNVSSRAAEILQEDMAASGPVRLRDVEEAQARVIATLRELESEGKLVLAGAGDDVFV